MTDFLSSLNAEQKEAVLHQDGPLLVVAGAGSGKTRVITARIIVLIQKGVSAKDILAVTFTNKAAEEMKTRVFQYAKSHVTMGTFHSVCLGILRREGRAIGLAESFIIYDEQDQLSVVKECLKALQLDLKEMNPKHFVEKISQCKDRLLNSLDIKDDPEYQEPHFFDIYDSYQRRLKDHHGVDFGDLIMKTVELFEKNPDILARYQSRYRYVLVDEYQDTNYAQHQFIYLIAKGHQNITVVGDPDQSIYEWRGADIQNILEFEKMFKNVKVVKLEQNYRSTNTILKAANAVITHNTHRKHKELWSKNGEGALIDAHVSTDERGEARFLVRKIAEMRRDGYKMKDMAAFYRTNAQSRVLEEELIQSGIPYKVVSGVKFYARKEIKDVLAYLRVIFNPRDEVSLLRIINTPKRGIGEEAVKKISELAQRSSLGFFDGIKFYLQTENIPARLKNSLTQFCSMIEGLRGVRLTLTLTQLLESVMEDSGYIKALEDDHSLESKNRIENIQEFFSSIADFEEAYHGGADVLQAYLEYISLQTDLDSWQHEEDIFTLMTLHSAKGLEFSVVFILGMEEGLLPHGSSIYESQDELEEERRLCYVGITRAKQRLFLSYTQSRRIFGTTKIQRPSRFLLEIPQHLLSAPLMNRKSHHFSYGFHEDDVWDSSQTNPRSHSRYYR
ncbi:MAG TPA: UvrD-helicase domain-containing protein [Candidatus Omnitrophota bacterium]|nr:UvrD-helicase domain-containing protein [Candidatus Omnitrophota bacterium]